ACSVPGSAQCPFQPDSGYGLCGADALWSPAGGAGGLQSQKEGPSLLSSGAVLRSLSSGILARLVATGQYFGQYRGAFLFSNVPGQSTFHYGSLAHTRQSRLGILRRQVSGPAGAARIELCDCSQKLQ